MTQLLDTTVYCLHQRWSDTVTRHLSCTQRGLCDSCRSTMIIEIAPWALDCSNALSNLQIIAGNSNWKGAWKKALSDFRTIAILSFQITLYLLEKIRENLTLQKDSLRILFLAPLLLLICGTVCCCCVWLESITFLKFWFFNSPLEMPLSDLSLLFYRMENPSS